ncbi:MAG: peptidase caspase catalytic subunit p20 [Myxococcaceae bacterium]|nr:peptidase caspase catalytic subunit p20 [Myxococcaceae bacterium]
MTRVLLTALLFLLPVGWPARAGADAGLHSYALVVGSNRGGDGQGKLSYAKQDAERMVALLRELGRTPPGNIELLAEPTAEVVERALSRLRAKLVLHAEAGERAQVLFYYSGHARAHALSLGSEELPLTSLRASLLALPSTLTVVVLDACQSGAFSGVKGARQAADFSLSSVRDLNSSGIAVMASSTGSELSQESSELGSSYFTHHLLVSLRGAGDLDRNGRVSLDEAYRYAYQHTLTDTARTQVGSQHATLETDLTGRGDVPLSYPVDADAQLALPADVEGRVLVQTKNGPVMAELVKARGGTLLLALPSGVYDVLVRSDTTAESCSATLSKGAVHTLALSECHLVELAEQHSKIVDLEQQRTEKQARESWFLEYGVNLSFPRRDAFADTMQRFGYVRSLGGGFGPTAALGRELLPYLSVLARYDWIETGHSFRDTAAPGFGAGSNALNWRTHSVMAGLRLRLPLVRRWVVAFTELDAGMSLTRSRFDYALSGDAGAGNVEHGDKKLELGFAVRAVGGFTFNMSRHFGLWLAAGYTHAPSVSNQLGQTHEAGGATVQTGLRFNGVKGWW